MQKISPLSRHFEVMSSGVLYGYLCMPDVGWVLGGNDKHVERKIMPVWMPDFSKRDFLEHQKLYLLSIVHMFGVVLLRV